jgi:hypothetical protein
MSIQERSQPLELLHSVRLRSIFTTHLASGGLAALITSRHLDPTISNPELLSIEFQAARQLRTRQLLEVLQRNQDLPAVDISLLRSQLSSFLAGFLSRHLLESQKIFVEESEPLKRLAHRHSQLVSWGDSKAAKAIADIDSVPVRTIHTYLYHARRQGYQDFPGKGIRS